MMRRLGIFAAAFALAAAGFILLGNAAAALITAAVTGALAGVFLLLRDRRLRAARIFLLGLCVGLLWCAGYRAVFLGRAARHDGERLPVTVTALAAPSKTPYGAAVPVELPLEGRRLSCTLYLRESAEEICPGDCISCTAKLRLVDARSKKASDRYSQSHGVWFRLSAGTGAAVTHPAHPGVRFWPACFSMLLRQKINTVFDADSAGFLSALLTGGRGGLDMQTRNELSIAGIYHTVAVSGMHVSILLGMVMQLCGSRRRLAAAIGVPTIAFFVLMTGAPASAVRAGVMQTLLLLAPLVQREDDPITSLSAAGLFLLLVNPWTLLDVGFQLSFASAAGILLFAGRFYRALAERRALRACLRRGGIGGQLAAVLVSSVSCSAASMTFALPLSAYYFGTVSLVAPLVNMLTLWAVSLIFTAGMLIALLALVWTGAAYGPAWLLSWLVRYVLLCARGFSKLPCAAIYPENFYMTAWCVLLYGAVLFYALSPVRPRFSVTAASLAAALCAALVCAYAQFHLPYFTFTALDVGQGQCLVYQRGTWTAVIDCGGSTWNAGEDAARYLQSYGEYRIEALILTHYDADHAGGAAQLIERQRVERVLLPRGVEASDLKETILAKAAERGTEVIFVDEDLLLSFDGGELCVFAPLSDKDSNDSGISVLASAGEYDMLITGDMTAKTELRLLTEKDIPQAELLVAGHHGARTSTSLALLSGVRPQTVLISVGEDNAYGHPSPQTLARIDAAGAEVYRTDMCGTITIRGPRHGKTNGKDSG